MPIRKVGSEIPISDTAWNRVACKPEHRKRDDPDRDHDPDRLYRATKSESEHLILSLLFEMWRTSLSAGNEKSRKREAAGNCVGTALFLFGHPVGQNRIVCT